MDQSKQHLALPANLRLRLDTLLEGIQIIDREWRYVYLNDIMLRQVNASRENFLGHTLMEKFPGIEHTEVFRALEHCMASREPVRFENEFTFPDGTSQWFELAIEPVPEGICVLSLDITPFKQALENIRKSKSLYAFLSQINQSIVHVRSQKKLFDIACQTAVEHGGFRFAWIGLFDKRRRKVFVSAQNGKRVKAHQPKEFPYVPGDEQYRILQTGHYQLEENCVTDPSSLRFGMCSCIALPVRTQGKIIGSFNLYSDRLRFIGPEEIRLLLEVSRDISFALENFEKAKRHRETEEKVVANERRFRALIEKSADMKTLASRNGKLLYGSPSITRVLGYEPEDTDDLNIFDLIHPDDQPAYGLKRSELANTPGAFFHFEMRLRHKKGHWVWCEGTATNLLDEPGVEAIVSNFIDITDKKRVVQLQEFERNNLYALINNTHDLFWSVDTDFRLITSNQPFDNLMLRVNRNIVKPGDNILHNRLSAQNHQMYYDLYQRAFKGEMFSVTVSVSIARESWWEISFYPIRKRQEIVGTACHARDITQRRNDQEVLQRTNEELRSTNAELDRFVYSISHDLRSPLTSIRGLLAIIDEETREDITREHTALIRGRIDRLDAFIKTVLSFSRNKRTGLDVSRLDIEAIAQEIVESLQHLPNASNVGFKIGLELDEDFHSDRLSVCTLVENLVSNAIKFKSGDKSEPYISISGKTTADGLELQVSDNGIGIPEHEHERIFEMFYRLPTPTEGSGIGLYIVRQIVEKLHGSIRVESAEGEGTTFRIFLKNLQHEY